MCHDQKRQRRSSPPGQSPGAILNAGLVNQAAPEECSDAEHASSFPGVLGTVPPEMLFRILSFLSAEDLASTAQACRYLRNATSSGVLWRRLFLARWDTCCCSRWSHIKSSWAVRPHTWLCTGGVPLGTIWILSRSGSALPRGKSVTWKETPLSCRKSVAQPQS